jgi:uncharacterized membrane protein YtjA (UPF0391 family)
LLSAKVVEHGSSWEPPPKGDFQKETIMTTLITLAIIFFIIALVAYLFGARGMAGMSAGMGRTLLGVFVILAIIFLILGLVNR